MFKKTGLAMITALLVGGLVFGGCSQQNPSNPSENSTTNVQSNNEENSVKVDENSTITSKPNTSGAEDTKSSVAKEIKAAFQNIYSNSDFSNQTVTVEMLSGVYAKGGIPTLDNGDGDWAWFAKKVDSVWTIVADGQYIQCPGLDEFPAEFKTGVCD
ncbi:MAG: hypothetical protein WC843_03905 [Candidatus Gracilibacteria bacterium]|jgi:hypothetical protein